MSFSIRMAGFRA